MKMETKLGVKKFFFFFFHPNLIHHLFFLKTLEIKGECCTCCTQKFKIYEKKDVSKSSSHSGKIEKQW
jgi:hypothetical protein